MTNVDEIARLFRERMPPAQNDDDLRAYCLFGNESLTSVEPIGPSLPQELQAELDAAVDEADGLTFSEGRRRMRELAWSVHDRYALRGHFGQEEAGKRPSPNVATTMAMHAARARKRGARATLTMHEWSNILAAFDGRCAYCLAECKITVDHIVPISQGGSHAADNVVPACWSCNTSKGDKDVVDWIERRGLSLSEVLDRINCGQSRALAG